MIELMDVYITAFEKRAWFFLWLLEKDVMFKCWMSTADCLAFPEDDNADNGDYDWAILKDKDDK